MVGLLVHFNIYNCRCMLPGISLSLGASFSDVGIVDAVASERLKNDAIIGHTGTVMASRCK